MRVRLTGSDCTLLYHRDERELGVRKPVECTGFATSRYSLNLRTVSSISFRLDLLSHLTNYSRYQLFLALIFTLFAFQNAPSVAGEILVENTRIDARLIMFDINNEGRLTLDGPRTPERINFIFVRWYLHQ